MTQVSTVPMHPDEQEAFMKVVERTRRLVRSGDEYLGQVVDPPRPGSPIADAYAAKQRDAFDLASLLLFACQDHLRTLVILGDARFVPSFAGYTLIRAAAEAAVRSRHLLDLSVGHQDRLARTLNERLSNIVEQGKVLDPSHATSRIEHLERRAASLGIETLTDRRGRTIGFGTPRLSMLTLFEQHLEGGETAWRVLSAYAHSMQWMLAPRSRATPSAEPDVALVATQVDTGQLLALWLAVLDTFDEAALHWVILAGMPGDVWTIARGEGD